MAAEKEREAVKKLSPLKSWKDKVDRMPDNQVVAIYLRLKNKQSL